MAWTEELKAKAIAQYQAANPTAETSTEIIKEIAETLEQSPNGVRQVLVQAHVYVKKDVATTTKTTTTGGKTATGEGTKRVSKESQIDELRAAITDLGATVDEDIITKLTGKAAAYFVSVLKTK